MKTFCCGLLGALVCALSAPAAADFRAGVAGVDITPPLGIPMAGYYHARGADGVLDPLFSRALVLESGGERAALVVLDLISVTRSITDQARTAIQQATGIARKYVTQWGLSDAIGPVLVGDHEEEIFLGQQIMSRRPTRFDPITHRRKRGLERAPEIFPGAAGDETHALSGVADELRALAEGSARLDGGGRAR